jgi:hypothetical protein
MAVKVATARGFCYCTVLYNVNCNMAPVRKLLTFGLDTEEGLHFMVTQQIQIWLPCQTLGLQETNLTASESVFKQ